MDSNFLQISGMDVSDIGDKIERMYPDIYHQIIPYIDDILETLGEEEIENLTEEEIADLVTQIEERFAGAVNPMGGHGPSAMNDIARILLLGAIANRYQRRPMFYPPYGYPFFYPFPVMPFFPGHCGHGRCSGHRGRGRGGSRGRGGRRW